MGTGSSLQNTCTLINADMCSEKILLKTCKSSFRSSRPEVFCEKGVLRNFAKFTGKHLCQSLFFNKVAGGQLYFRNLLNI